MKAAQAFLAELKERGLSDSVARVQVDLYGSLALTGKGHATDTAVLMGLIGEAPETIDPSQTEAKLSIIRDQHRLNLGGSHTISFEEERDIIFNCKIFLDAHPNALRFQAFNEESQSEPLHEATYYSIGGGFIVREGATRSQESSHTPSVPYPFDSARQLLEISEETGLSFSQISYRNELCLRSEAEITDGMARIWTTMQQCVTAGCHNDGILPGGLKIKRRAPELFRRLQSRKESLNMDPMGILDWVDLYAIAVNEENAAGGRVVTAPTNGAAGIIPATMHYFKEFCREYTPEKIETFLLTAAVIGSLYKRNASISGAEVGCQGEVGVACSMAAGALTEVLGGTPGHVEQAAEIGMEHNLGLTCDPIGGLVQIPCIERNAMGAVKAINASRLALRGDGHHFVSLDRVIAVMKRTGADMSSQYKETSQGGLAVNISEC
jgi:L-serine dehydratase